MIDAKQLTNVEIIYREDLKNKLLVAIPKTPYHILFSYTKKNNKWRATLVQIMTNKRKTIAEKLNDNGVAELTTFILTHGMPQMKRNTFKAFTEYLKRKIQKNTKK